MSTLIANMDAEPLFRRLHRLSQVSAAMARRQTAVAVELEKAAADLVAALATDSLRETSENGPSADPDR